MIPIIEFRLLSFPEIVHLELELFKEQRHVERQIVLDIDTNFIFLSKNIKCRDFACVAANFENGFVLKTCLPLIGCANVSNKIPLSML